MRLTLTVVLTVVSASPLGWLADTSTSLPLTSWLITPTAFFRNILSAQKPSCAASIIFDTVKHGIFDKYSNRALAAIRKDYLDSYGTWEKGRGLLNKIPINTLAPNDTHLILRFGEYVGISYCENSVNMQNMASVNMRIGSFIIERTGYDTSGNVIYYIATNIQQNTTALVLRGSATREDLRLDLRSDVGRTNFSQVFEGLEMERAQVHHGFWTRFMQFRRKIHTDVDAVLKRRNTTFVVVGHSLGAAWAFVHAADIAYNAKYPIYGAYIYGMPLVGNAEFADAMADIIGTDKVIRLVSKNDVVPHVGFLKGSHPTKVNEYFVEMDGIVPRVCDGGQDKTCSLKIPCRQWSWEHHSSIGLLSTRMELCRLENSPIPDAVYN